MAAGSIVQKYNNWKDDRPQRMELYRALVKLFIPIAVQNLLASLVNTADIWMLNFVGQDELSAVSLANQYMFLLWGFFFGINSATTLMNSQYWGKGDTRTIQAVLGIALKLSMGITFLVSAACILFPGRLMLIYTSDTRLIAIGTTYLRTISLSYFLMSFGQSYLCTLRSVEQAAKSTVISTITLFINVGLNAVFIFGLFGAPRLGVMGVALATTIARVIELLLCLIDYMRGSIFKPELKLLFGHHPTLLKDFAKYAGPALVNDLSWTVAFSSYSVILGHLNNDMVAAFSVVSTIQNLFTTVCFGLGSGGTVIIGKELGSNRLDRAKRDAATLCHMTLLLAAFLGGILVLCRHVIMGVFTNLSAQAYAYLNVMMIISGYYIVGQAINTLLIGGIFRAGGNTTFGMICDTITMWCVSVPLGFITAFVLKLPPLWVYFVLCLDEFWKMPVVYKYYKSYKWINNITREDAV